MDVSVIPKKTRHLIPTPHLQQTAYWGRLKKQQGRQARAFDLMVKPKDPGENSQTASMHAYPEGGSRDMLVVLRSLGPDSCMAYVPFGPELLPDEERRGCWLENLSEELRTQLPENCVFIRYDLPWQSPWVDEPDRYTGDNQWKGAPKIRIQEMRMNFDTEHWNLRKAPTDLLPPDTVLVDVASDRDRILARMKPKTRYNIGLSARKGVSVRDAGMEGLPAWYDLYCQTARRHHMSLNDMDYFASVFQVKNRQCQSPASVHLLLAEAEGKPLAGIILAISGSRATYLYGASSSVHKNRMASYAVQWEAISRAHKAECREYDLFGVSPYPDPEHPMYGLYRFKTGFGGWMLHRQGCWDYPLDEAAYDVYRASEMAGSGFIMG
ncbi:MAG: peptidoglycan bridge formation glycyltransferase FemA/FemB family protein [Desulfosalsimonas sp.]|uniref:lipid II:glycine glycyltransferase FemX n=1 Tax=Desulfosalsimonas sp. TaxID=3073848 RepID=UPI0039706BB1